MALSPNEHQAVLAHVNRTWLTKLCPMCGANNWMLYGVIRMSLIDSTTPPNLWHNIYAQTMPTAAMLCQNCGNTVLVNMVVAGAARSS